MHRSGAAMAWNVFKFCTALRGLGSVMILLVLGVVGVTYYTVVLTNYGPALYAGGLDSLIAIVVLILFHSLVRLRKTCKALIFFGFGIWVLCSGISVLGFCFSRWAFLFLKIWICGDLLHWFLQSIYVYLLLCLLFLRVNQ